MIKSMTGFGRGESIEGALRCEVEIRGVNHRFLEVRFRMPQEFSELEFELRQLVSKVVRRGRVDVWVERTQTLDPPASVSIHRGVVAAYLESAAGIAKEFSIPGVLDLHSVLTLPGAVRVDFKRDGGSEGEKGTLLQALERGLQSFEQARVSEGEKLREDMRMRLEAMSEDLDRIRQGAARTLPETLEKIQKRMASLLDGVSLDPTRLAQEAAYLAGRSDIAEEVVRLGAHLNKALEILEKPGGPAGKALDFLVQELHREVNTIASKSESLEISQIALKMKSEVERVREQVQNIE